MSNLRPLAPEAFDQSWDRANSAWTVGSRPFVPLHRSAVEARGWRRIVAGLPNGTGAMVASGRSLHEPRSV
jgi:hypothetical protein